MLEPAKTVIDICGGIPAVAEMTGRDKTRVYRWMQPRERGGTGGLIPAEAQQALIAEARARKLPLRPDHFFPPESGEDAA